MKILQSAVTTIVNTIGNLNPRKYVWGFTRPTNVFESPKQAMFASIEPRRNTTRMTEWRARFIGARAAEDPDRAFFEALDNLADQIAVCQGLRTSYRFGSGEIQTRIMRAEDRIQEAMEMLYSVRPEDSHYIASSSDLTGTEETEVPEVPAYIVAGQEKKEDAHAVH